MGIESILGREHGGTEISLMTAINEENINNSSGNQGTVADTQATKKDPEP